VGTLGISDCKPRELVEMKSNPQSSAVTKSMRSNKAKDTKPELIVRKMLWAAGLRGYRLHRKDIPGKPDIAFIGKKIAIFVNGCFWHRCPHCKPGLPKHNRKFWLAKFNRNQERDRENLIRLRKAGWKVVTIWECRLKGDANSQINYLTNKTYPFYP